MGPGDTRGLCIHPGRIDCRKPGTSLYLVATVVLGYLSSLGLTELLFRALHHGHQSWEGLDWTVGFFLFVILVAVGEDYNILLMARALEEQRKFGVVEGTRRAVAQTGGIISSCGLIMAGTFGSMLAGSLTSLRELGLALALGVLLDTFLVRPILVPAFVIVIDRAQRRRSERALHASTCGGRSAMAIFAPGGERAAKESFGRHAHLNAIVREANEIASQALIVNDLVPEAAGGRP